MACPFGVVVMEKRGQTLLFHQAMTMPTHFVRYFKLIAKGFGGW
jgi:hypothetical protein